MIFKKARKAGRLIRKKTKCAGMKPDFSPEAALRVEILLRSKKKRREKR